MSSCTSSNLLLLSKMHLITVICIYIDNTNDLIDSIIVTIDIIVTVVTVDDIIASIDEFIVPHVLLPRLPLLRLPRPHCYLLRHLHHCLVNSCRADRWFG